MFGLGWHEIALILLVLILLFGAKRLPELAKSLGKSLQEFKKGVKSEDEKEKSGDENKDKPQE